MHGTTAISDENDAGLMDCIGRDWWLCKGFEHFAEG